jgi:transposase
MKSYRPWQPTQSFLLPQSPAEWLPEGHLAFWLLDVLAALDISEVERVVQSKDGRGERPYSPRMMLGLLIYGYCTGVFSSRRIHRATYEDVAFRVLASGQQPFHTTISDFRRDHLAAFKGLFLQVLRMCQEAGLVKLGHVALDGTKVQANASKHKAMSYGHMKKTEEKLKAEIEELLSKASTSDAADDARLGVNGQEQDIPSELARREKRLAKIAEAKAALEAEARKTRAEHLAALACEQAALAAKATTTDRADASLKRANKTIKEAERIASSGPDDSPPASGGQLTPDGLPTHRTPATVEGLPTEDAQRNFTDPDSRIMKSSDGFLQGYNCQQAVDGEHQVIVAQSVTNQGTDNHNLCPMVEQVRANLGNVPTAVTADTGYWIPSVMQQAAALGTTVYVALGREKNWEKATAAPNEARQAMAQRLSTVAGADIYRQRKFVVEPVHGQIKEARGFRRFHLRGLEKAGAEWSLVCLGHNLLKLFRFGGAAPKISGPAAAMA